MGGLSGGQWAPPHPAQPWGVRGLTVLLDLQADTGAGGDGGIGGDDAVVFLKGFGDEAPFCIRQELPREQHRGDGHDLVVPGDLW